MPPHDQRVRGRASRQASGQSNAADDSTSAANAESVTEVVDSSPRTQELLDNMNAAMADADPTELTPRIVTTCEASVHDWLSHNGAAKGVSFPNSGSLDFIKSELSGLGFYEIRAYRASDF